MQIVRSLSTVHIAYSQTSDVHSVGLQCAVYTLFISLLLMVSVCSKQTIFNMSTIKQFVKINNNCAFVDNIALHSFRALEHFYPFSTVFMYTTFTNRI